MVVNNVELLADAPHSIVTTVCIDQPKYGASAYLFSDTPAQTIAGRVAWGELLRTHGKAVYVELTHLFDTFSRVPQARGSAGWIWEQYVDKRITEGGTFTVRPIPPNPANPALPDQAPTEEETFTILPLTLHLFDDKVQLSATSDRSQYFIPNRNNNPTFDSFLYSETVGIGLQMTLSNTHSLKPKGLNKLYKRLRYQNQGNNKPWFVVVIRKGHTCTLNPSPTGRQLAQFRFFTMELELPPSVYHSFM